MATKFRQTGKVPDSKHSLAQEWTPDMSERKRRTSGGEDLIYVGTVVNPKTMRPYFVYSTKKVTGVLAVPSGGGEVVIVGNGYLETDRHSDYNRPAEELKVPRVHTPRGVADKKTGLGTALYVGMAIVATYVSRMKASNLPYPGDGICSGEGASDAAVAWWTAAVKSGLAEKSTYTVEGESTADGGSASNDMEIDLTHEDDSLRLGARVQEENDRWCEDQLSGDAQETGRSISHRGAEAIVRSHWNDESIDDEEDSFDWRIQNFSGVTVGTLREIALKKATEFYESLKDWTVPDDMEVISLKASWTVHMDWEERTAGDDEEFTAFLLWLDTAIEKKLVLDLSSSLENDMDSPLDNVDLLDTILNLDLSEITDPVAIRYFYGLADYHGATLTQMNRFRNRVEAHRSYFQSFDAPDIASAYEDLSSEFAKHRMNPVSASPYHAAARRIYGPLADLA